MEIPALLRGEMPRLFTEENFSFSRHTTLGCGGVARIAAYPSCAEELVRLLCILKREGVPCCFLGAGANVLAGDGFYEGVVVRFSRMEALFSDGRLVFAGAGVTGGRLCRFAREACLGGFEPFTGIPMTVGGAVAMNAGVREGRIGDRVEGVLAVRDGRLVLLDRYQCGFGEKDSRFLREGIAVAGAYFYGAYAERAQIERNLCYFRQKRRRLPKGRSMGCTFVNPTGDSAGRLIDGCGLKGARVGGARVSEEHANFILSEGATAEDVSRLIALVRDSVYRQTGTLLREEIRRIGDT